MRVRCALATRTSALLLSSPKMRRCGRTHGWPATDAGRGLFRPPHHSPAPKGENGLLASNAALAWHSDCRIRRAERLGRQARVDIARRMPGLQATIYVGKHSPSPHLCSGGCTGPMAAPAVAQPCEAPARFLRGASTCGWSGPSDFSRMAKARQRSGSASSSLPWPSYSHTRRLRDTATSR